MKLLRWTAGLGSLVGALGGVPPLVIASVIIIVLAGGIAEKLALELVRANDQRTVAELFWRRRSAPPADADPPDSLAPHDEEPP